MAAVTSRPANPSVDNRPELAEDQKRQLIEGVAGLLRNLVMGAPAALPSEVVSFTQTAVSGAFVSLKRGKHLRSCSGLLGQTIPMHQALAHAAERSVWEDERFPPISPSELEHLSMEVWLLFEPQPVAARGQARADAITLGKHGIRVFRGQSSALFLPSVATENDWDAVTFLNRVCMKAGLPASAWKEDDTALFTFEGDVLHTTLAELNHPKLTAFPGPCQKDDLAGLLKLCRANIRDVLTGAVPHYFVGAPDGMLNGAVLTLGNAGDAETPTFSRISLRPGVPLQATVFGLVQAAAQYLASQRPSAEVLDTMPLGLALLHDPMLHGTVADPHLAGFDPRTRALLVMERNKAGLAMDVNQSADEVMTQAADQARVSHPEAAGVISLAVVSNLEKLTFSSAPKPVRGPAVRPPAVAGTFYDGDATRLSKTVDEMLAGSRQPGNWHAAMVPHAGLRFSGRIAADVFKRLKIPQTVIILGPNHTGLGMEWAVAPHQTWSLPGIEMASDFMLGRKLSQAIPGLEMDAVAHQQEHGIEVELPFLAKLAPESKVIGITIGHGDLDSCRRFAAGLAEVIRGRPDRPLLLISSDMNHFATDAETRHLDEIALAALQRGDPEELYNTVTGHNISMCGLLPAVIVLETLRILESFKKAERVSYATTADVTGDKSRVVGYAGMLFG